MNENYKEVAKPAQSEHLEVANKMADEIVSRFNAEQQNQVLSRIKEVIIQSRENVISSIKKELEYLTKFTEELSR